MSKSKEEVIKGYVGSWAPFIGSEFTKPYMASINNHVNKRKKAGEQVNGSPFECFKRVNMTDVKILIICDDLRHMDEKSWLSHEQGVMFFPRHMTWGDQIHHEWRAFSETVLLMILRYKVLVFCDIPVIRNLINKMSPSTIIVSKVNWDMIEDCMAYKEVIIPF